MKPSKLSATLLAALALLAASTPAPAQTAVEKTPAFPGAEGFGRYVTGGRGGAVYHVTSLEDDGSEGTFRWACNQKGTRTIVFDVAGTIYLTSALSLSNGNVTIAGQSAPGDGVCIADYPFSIQANNVIIRYMRFRLGNNNVALEGADGWDGLGGMDQEDIIIDHCSVSWSIDECLSVYGVKNSTVQWCISSQSLQDAGHSKGNHGYGGNWGGSGVTYHHNLMAHHESRVPRLGPRYTTQLDERLDMRNNVFYNWGGNGCYGGEAMKVNIVNNYYKPGPATEQISGIKKMRIAAVGVRTNAYVTTYPAYAPTLHVWGKFFVDGNVNSSYSQVTNDNWTYGMYNQIDASGADGTYTAATKDSIRLEEPMDFVHVTTHSADSAYSKVLKYVGCSKSRDSYDEFIINEVRNGLATYTGSGNHKGIIDSPQDNRPADAADDWSPWPELAAGRLSQDSDLDGMPDLYEENHNLDSGDPSDGAIIGADGYSNLEVYLNSLVASITAGGLADGEVLGNDINEGDEPAATEYEISPLTSSGDWTFSSGCTITTSKSYSTGSGGGITGIKFSRNENYVIGLPEGVTIEKVKVVAYCNVDNAEAYVATLGSNTYAATDYVFPSRTTSTTAEHTITLATPATGSMILRFGGQQVVANITLYPSTTTDVKAPTAPIELSSSQIYTIEGVPAGDDKSALSPGLYIINGKQTVVK